MGLQKLREGKRSGYEALNILNVNIDKYEQRQCNQLAGTFPIQCGSVGRIFPFTSLHTTGSLCVPVNEEKQKLLLVQKFCLLYKKKKKKRLCIALMDILATWASSSSVKSFLMLKVFLISSGVLPLIMLATVLQVTSNRPLMSK